MKLSNSQENKKDILDNTICITDTIGKYNKTYKKYTPNPNTYILATGSLDNTVKNY